MKSVIVTTVLLGGVTLFASAASAEKTQGQPAIFKALLDCRGIADNAQRLACYDQAAGAMDEAQKKKDLVVLDRKQVRETRKSLFGFALPKIDLFGGDKPDMEKDDITEISSTVAAARMRKDGSWSLQLADDAGTWEATSTLRFDPRPGDKIRIGKGVMGGYLGQVGDNRGVRFRRVE